MTGAVSVFTSDLWRRSADRLAELDLPWDRLRGSVVVVVGGSGAIGGAHLAALAHLDRRLSLGLRLVGTSRGAVPTGAQEAGVTWVAWDVQAPAPRELTELRHCSGRLWVIHAAATTTSSAMVGDPLGVLHTSYEGTRRVLDWAYEQEASGVLNLSSVEAYGQPARGADEPPLTEGELGDLDLMDPRSCYPLGKRVGEHLCRLYQQQHGLATVSVRLGPALGVGLPAADTRVAAQFVRAAAAGTDIVLRSSGQSRANFVDIADAIDGMLTAQLVGAPGACYNLVNPLSSRTILEFAQIVADTVGGGRCAVRVEPLDRSVTGHAAPTRHRVSVDPLLALGWRPRVALPDSVRGVAAYWAEQA